MGALSHPRRQQLKRLKRAALATAAAGTALIAALLTALAGIPAAAVMLLLIAVALGLHARHWARLASRARVGARSESQVHRALSALEREGWRTRHSLPWHGHGDIDHVAIAPTGIAFAIETKTRTYHPGHLTTVHAQAAWLEHRRRRWCPHGALPVLCVTRGPQVEHIEDDVLVVCLGRLNSTLRATAATGHRPGFLSPSGHPS